MQDIIERFKEFAKTETGKAFMQTQYVGMKIGIEALLRSCEEAYKQGLFSIDSVRFMAEHQINTINMVLEEVN